jgi:hypothetical protein
MAKYAWYVPRWVIEIHQLYQYFLPDNEVHRIFGLEERLVDVVGELRELKEQLSADKVQEAKLEVLAKIVVMQQALVRAYVPAFEAAKLNDLVGNLVKKHLTTEQASGFYRGFPQFTPTNSPEPTEVVSDLGELIQQAMQSEVQDGTTK